MGRTKQEKVVHAAYMREYRKKAKVKVYYRDYFRRWRAAGKAMERKQKRKMGAIAQLGTYCRDCGLDLRIHPECADFDHVRGHRVNHIGRLLAARWELFEAELEKCELVCANCHRIRTHHRLTGNKSCTTIGEDSYEGTTLPLLLPNGRVEPDT